MTARSWSPAPEATPTRLTDRTSFLILLVCLIGLVLSFVIGQHLQDQRLREQCQAGSTATACAGVGR